MAIAMPQLARSRCLVPIVASLIGCGSAGRRSPRTELRDPARRRPRLRRLGLLRSPNHPHAAPRPDGRRGNQTLSVLCGAPLHPQPSCSLDRPAANPQRAQRRAFPELNRRNSRRRNHPGRGAEGTWLRNHRASANGTSAICPPYLPTRHGFDHYFGIPYSNDMDVKKSGASSDPTLARRNDHRATGRARNPHSALHPRGALIHPQPSRHRAGPSRSFSTWPIPSLTFRFMPARLSAARAREGSIGDAVEEIDWSVGQILAALRDEGLAESTLVVFTSDNGPWLSQKLQGRLCRAAPRGQGLNLGRRRPRAVPGLVARYDRARAHRSRPRQRARPVHNLPGSGRRKDS